MVKMMLLLSLATIQLSFAETYFLRNGQTAYISGHKVICGGSLPTCESSCQHYDTITNVCFYRIQCDYTDEGELKKTSCQYFDNVHRRCLREKREYFRSRAPNCTESCQYFDRLNGHCQYMTKCLYVNDNCVEQTRCERYDNFTRTCRSEARRVSCR